MIHDNQLSYNPCVMQLSPYRYKFWKSATTLAFAHPGFKYGAMSVPLERCQPLLAFCFRLPTAQGSIAMSISVCWIRTVRARLVCVQPMSSTCPTYDDTATLYNLWRGALVDDGVICWSWYCMCLVIELCVMHESFDEGLKFCDCFRLSIYLSIYLAI